MELQTILHPTDYNPSSQAALEQAEVLARECGARLVILHTVPLPRPSSGGLNGPAVLALLDELRRRHGADPRVPVEYLVSRDDPVSSIVRTAAARDCDLIIMGGDQPRDLQGLLSASVVEQVVRWAHCPVLVVKSALKAVRFRYRTENQGPRIEERGFRPPLFDPRSAIGGLVSGH
jgi:nucleotide-binding universal stress UspA family protein